MSDKKEDAIAKILKYGFVVTLIFSILYYTCSEIYNATPEVSGRLSNVFSFVSSFGIIATIIVYLWQRNDQKRRDKDENSKKKESIKHLIKIVASNFDYSINNLEAYLNLGHTKNALNQLKTIDTKFLERCLIDSKDVNLSMFYNISYLLDAVIAQKKIIKERILMDKSQYPDYELDVKTHCYHAKKEIDMLYKIIIGC
ncbi:MULTISPECIES: hypothetical protein [unclassified Providencia]|uniref:hypothetical protein n=1 Tax=unclassified Providencia TaxID=2633465 RepID=UPI002349B096|nr:MULTISPECIES: hypothetical protein [unclassified Providencia]